MRRLILILFILTSIAVPIYAQVNYDDNEQKGTVSLGAGMTKKPIAGFTVVAAEDANVTTNGKQAFVEDIYEYVGRKFKAVEARLKKIEASQEEMGKRIKHLEKNLSKVKKTITTPKETKKEGQ